MLVIGLLLDQVVPEFSARYPGIQLDFAAQGALVDITAAGFDAGIRLIEDVPQDMVAIALGGPLTFVTVASPDYLAAHAPVRQQQDLLQQQYIRHRLPGGKRYRWEYQNADESLEIDVPGTLTLDNNALMARAAINGSGIAFVPLLYVSEALQQGEISGTAGRLAHSVGGNRVVVPAEPASVDGAAAVYRRIENPPAALPLNQP
ncbi:hypothetical protein E05_43370 [Plautia stali symbiont]|nr:hypothetical protein E05_43370 [Plautia stali symbiont]